MRAFLRQQQRRQPLGLLQGHGAGAEASIAHTPLRPLVVLALHDLVVQPPRELPRHARDEPRQHMRVPRVGRLEEGGPGCAV